MITMEYFLRYFVNSTCTFTRKETAALLFIDPNQIIHMHSSPSGLSKPTFTVTQSKDEGVAWELLQE